MTCNMLCKCPGIYNSDSAAMAISKDDLALIDDYGEMADEDHNSEGLQQISE